MTTVLLVVVGLILVGLPVLALVADRLLPPPKWRPPPPADPHDQVRQQFGLAWQDAEEVAAAVRQGRATRPELQSAAASLAELTLGTPTFRGRPIPAYPLAVRRAVLVLAAATVVGYSTVLVIADELGTGVIYLLLYGGWLFVAVRGYRRRHERARAALVANS